MTDRLLDDLGRTLAQPMTRRRTMRLFAIAAAAAALPPLRPRLAMAGGGGTKLCYGATEFCAELTCGTYDECCEWVTNPGGPTCQVSRGCCDPCGFNNKCGGQGCESGGSTCDKCCKRREQGEPSFNAYPCECCQLGEIYTGTRCCTPRIAPDPCNSSEPRCRHKTFNKQRAAIKACERKFPFERVAVGLRLPRDPAGYINCVAKAEANNQPRRRCPQVADDGQCRNGPCDRGSLTCSRDCEPQSRQSGRASGLIGDGGAGEEPPERRAGGVSTRQLLGRLRAQQPRLRRSYLALVRQLEKPVADEPSAQKLAAAYSAHRKNVLRLRTSIGRGRGGRTQRRIVGMLNAEAAGLEAYRKAALAKDDAKVAALKTRGGKALRRAGAQATAVQRALGCDQYTC